MKKVILGGAQLGLNYGITNTLGMLSEAAAAQLLKHAYIAGIDTIDTAPGYGESQQRLGKCAAGDFHYISKVSVNGLSDAEDIRNEIKISLHKTLQDLQVSNLSALLVHDVTPMLTSTSIKNMVIETLQELKVSGLISAAGVSLYNSAQSKELCRDWFPDVIQLPVSILNQDMVVSGELRRLHAAGTEIHARSIFMQGVSLLTSLPEQLHWGENLIEPYYQFLQKKHITHMQASLAYINSIAEIDAVVTGFHNIVQLDEFFSCAGYCLPGADYASVHIKNEDFTNPARWLK